MSASAEFRDSSTAQRNLLLDFIASAETAREQASQPATATKRALSWNRWTTFVDSIGLGQNQFLERFEPWQKNVILGAFAQALRDGTYSSAQHQRLVKSTIRDSLGDVCQTFRENGHPDPGRDAGGLPCLLLQRQFRGYTNADPSEKPQKAVTCSLLRFLAGVRLTDEDVAVGQLAIGAFFFAMRSCDRRQAHRGFLLAAPRESSLGRHVVSTAARSTSSSSDD